jgi:pimeloyl-ACP methyl ester carboxylesterase
MAGMITRGDVAEYFRVYEYGRTTPKKVYLFGGWRTSSILFKPLVSDLTKQGYAVVLFVPKKRLIAVGTPYEDVVTASRLAVEEVDHRINIDKMIGIRHFAVFGISFGTIFALEAAKMIPEISRAVLLSPFGDFARHVELWPRHHYFRKVLASQSINQLESGKVLNKVGAAQNIALLKGKHVLVGYSRADTVIHTEVTEEMIRLLNRSGVHTEISIVRGNHLRGIITHLTLKRSYNHLLNPAPKSSKRPGKYQGAK